MTENQNRDTQSTEGAAATKRQSTTGEQVTPETKAENLPKTPQQASRPANPGQPKTNAAPNSSPAKTAAASADGPEPTHAARVIRPPVGRRKRSPQPASPGRPCHKSHGTNKAANRPAQVETELRHRPPPATARQMPAQATRQTGPMVARLKVVRPGTQHPRPPRPHNARGTRHDPALPARLARRPIVLLPAPGPAA